MVGVRALRWSMLFVTCVVALWLPASAIAQGPALGVRDGVFTVDGEKKFLLFFSYFGARRDDAVQQRTILRTAKNRGFDGARVFPNWWRDNVGGPCAGGQYDPHPLLRADGTLDSRAGDDLRALLAVAAEEGMLIQLALAYEPVAGMTFENFTSGVRALATALSGGFRHVFLDLQNEFNVAGAGGCKRAFSGADIRSLRDTVKAVDPARLVAASVANNVSPTEAWALHRRTGADILAFHEARIPGWAGQTDDHVNVLRAASGDAVPIFFSEPFPHSQAPASWGAEVWLEAARLAKQSGAAAWCLHTEAYFYWSTKPPLAPVEREIVEKIREALATVAWPRA